MVTCYLDESGTDEQSPTAVVGGLLLRDDQFFWLSIEWARILDKHRVQPPLHMREFGPHGAFKDFSHDQRRALFSDLVRRVNEYKVISIASLLTTREYREAFYGIYDTTRSLGVYGACFINLAILNGAYARSQGYLCPIPLLLDEGNSYRRHVVDAHRTIEQRQKEGRYLLNLGRLGFGTDKQAFALQAADMISWSVRRRIAGNFNSGFEPLAELFDQNHVEQEYRPDWMKQVKDALQDLRQEASEDQPPPGGSTRAT